MLVVLDLDTRRLEHLEHAANFSGGKSSRKLALDFSDHFTEGQNGDRIAA